MNDVKFISNVSAWPQGHDRVCACGTQGQLSPWDHMVWLKAVPESYVRGWVQQCLCVFVCICVCVGVCFIPALITSCHLNHTHINSATTSSHIILSLWYQICPLVQTPSLLTQLASTVTRRCVFSTLLTTLSSTHKLCFSHFLIASRWVT